MKVIIILIIISSLFLNCKNEINKVLYYDNGNIKTITHETIEFLTTNEFYENGQLKMSLCKSKKDNKIKKVKYLQNGSIYEILNFINDTNNLNGPYFSFYPDGSLNYYCNYKDGKRIGNCVKYFDSTHIHYVREFYMYEGEEYLNCNYLFGRNGSLLKENSTYVQIGSTAIGNKTYIEFDVSKYNIDKYEYEAIIMHYRNNMKYKIDTVRFKNNHYSYLYDDVLKKEDFFRISFWWWFKKKNDSLNLEQTFGQNLFFTHGIPNEFIVDSNFIIKSNQ